MTPFNSIKKVWPKYITGFFFIILLGAYANIFAIGSPYQPGSTLDPACIPGETNCIVQIIPSQTSNANKYLTTDGTSTSWSSSTLVLGGNFTTSGAYATTLTTTGTTTLTLPTTGTLATTSNINTAVSGTTNYIPKFTGTNIIGNSIIYDDGTNIGIGTASPSSKFQVTGDIRITSGSGGQIIFADGSTMSSSGLGSAAALSTTGDAIVTGDSDANASGDVILKTASNDRLHILNGGNVGINTATPSALFSVGATSPFQITNLGAVTALSYTGAGTGLTGTASSLTAGNVTTNANLTGHITSTGNATSLGSFTSSNLLTALSDETGTGLAVFATSPAFTTPNIGVATGTSLNLSSGAITAGAASFTTGAFSGTVTYSSANNRLLTTTSGATTGYIYSAMNNTGTDFYWGVENSAGNGIGWTGSPSAYTAFMGTTGARSMSFMTNSALRYEITSAGNHDFKSGTATFGGALTGTSATFSGAVTATGANAHTFGNASLTGRALVVQSGSAGQAIQLKNPLGGDGTISATGTATTMNYGFGTYSVANALYIQNDGNVGIGTTAPGAKFEVFASSARYLQIDSFGRIIGRVDDNSLMDNLTMENRADSATTNHGTRILANFGTNVSATAINAGALVFAKEQNWTATASTQDSYFALSTTLDGTMGEKLRVTSAGNVGIGTTAPGTTLHSLGANNASSTVGDGSTYYGGGRKSTLSNYGDQYGSGSAYDNSNSGTYGGKSGGYFKGGTGGTYAGGGAGIVAIGGDGGINNAGGAGQYAEGGAGIYAQGGVTGDGLNRTWAAYFNGGDIAVRNGGSILMSQAAVGLADSNSASIGYNGILFLNRVSGSGLIHIVFGNAAAQVGTITSTTTATSYNTSSDRRLKENIVTTARGLDALMEIQVADFNFISDPNHTLVQGFIAQNLYEVYPEAVTRGGDNPAENPWQVDYGRLTPLIVQAVQEMDIKVQDISSLDTTKSTSLGSLIKQFLADSTNGIGDFFANRVRTKEICVSDDVGETCVNKTQLDSLIAGAGSSGSTPPPELTPDTTAPTITLIGDSTITLSVGDTYTEQGASALDDIDGSITPVITGTVDTGTVGTYTITYTAIDASGNPAIEITRTVIVGEAL